MSDVTANSRCRRAVVDDTRRKIERALAVADTAEELATAAQAVLVAAEAEQIELHTVGLRALHAALAKNWATGR